MEHGRVCDRFCGKNLAAQLRTQSTDEISLPVGREFSDSLSCGRVPVGSGTGSGRELSELRRVCARKWTTEGAGDYPDEKPRGALRRMVPRIRFELSRSETGGSIYCGVETIRSRRRHAALADSAIAQRSHAGSDAGKTHTDRLCSG